MVPKGIVVSPDVFFDLFVLCIFFRVNNSDKETPEEYNLGVWTTVDCISRLLNQMNVITECQRKKLSEDRRVLAAFTRYAGLTHQTVNHRVAFDETKDKIIVQIPSGLVGQFDKKRILKDTRIFLTRRGYNCATVIERQYPWLSEDVFMDVYKKSRDEFMSKSRPAKAAIISKYRQKIADESEIEHFFSGQKN